jgi:hypothetical protein
MRILSIAPRLRAPPVGLAGSDRGGGLSIGSGPAVAAAFTGDRRVAQAGAGRSGSALVAGTRLKLTPLQIFAQCAAEPFVARGAVGLLPWGEIGHLTHQQQQR